MTINVNQTLIGYLYEARKTGNAIKISLLKNDGNCF